MQRREGARADVSRVRSSLLCGALALLPALAAAGDGDDATVVLADIVLTTPGRDHVVLREDFFALGDVARAELSSRAKDPEELPRRVAQGLLERMDAGDAATPLDAAWHAAVQDLCGARPSVPRHDGLVGRKRVDVAKLPESNRWPHLLFLWAALGWDGAGRYVPESGWRGRLIEPHRLHALLALGRLGDRAVIPLLGELILDETVQVNQRVELARELVRLLGEEADPWLRVAAGEAAGPSFEGHLRGAEFTPYLLRRETAVGPGRSEDAWGRARRLEAARRIDPEQFDAALTRMTKSVFVYEAEHKDAGHTAGVATENAWRATRSDHGAGHVLYGPYTDDIPEGRFLARYRVRCTGIIDEGPMLVVDVCHNKGLSIASTRTVLARDVTDGEWSDVFLGFENLADAKTELRVRWTGRCDLEIDNVTVFEVARFPTKAPRLQTWPEIYTRPAAARRAAGEHLFRRALESRGQRYRVFRDAYLRCDSRVVVPAAGPGDTTAAWTAEIFAQRGGRYPEAWDSMTRDVGRAFESLAWHLSPEGMHRPDMQPGLQIIATGHRSISVRGEAADIGIAGLPVESRLPRFARWHRVLSEIALYGWLGDALDNRPPPKPDEEDEYRWRDIGDDPFDEPIRLHALTHVARLGEPRALPRLELFVADEDANAGLRGFALASLVLMSTKQRDELLTRYAPASAPPELHATCARWLGEYEIMSARPHLWRTLAGATDRDVTHEARALGALLDVPPARSRELDRETLEIVSHPWPGKVKTEFGPNHPHGMAQASLNTNSLAAGRPLIARVRLKYRGTGIDPETIRGILVDPVSGEPFTRCPFAVERLDKEKREIDLLAPFERKRGQKAALRVFWSAVWTGGSRDRDGGGVSVLGMDVLALR